MSAPQPDLSETLADPTALAAPRARGVLGRAPALSTAAVRSWMLTAVLVLVPLLAYWPTTFHEFGLRDDYSNLRESHEEPGKILQFCASHARPIYGFFLQSSYGRTSSVEDLRWMRLAGALILGAISLAMFRGLQTLGWSFEASLCVSVLLPLLPASQVIAAWAVGWPYAAAALLAIGGFFAAEGALTAPAEGAGRLAKRAAQWTGACALMLESALTYQPSTLFYVVPLAAALTARPHRSRSLSWLGAHVSLIAVSLALAYAVMMLLYSHGVFVRSGRVAFEQHFGEKLAWFLGEALPNALSLLVLNDDHHRGRGAYLACAAAIGLVLLVGLTHEWRRHGPRRGLIWLAGLAGLPVLAFGINLIAAERYATYRTLLAMSAVLVCFLVASMRALTAHWPIANRTLLAALGLTAAFLAARHHAYALIAVPQGNEWQLILDGAKRVRLGASAPPRVFAIASTPEDASTASIYHDEFGSLSSNSEWVPKEMFKRAMHDLHPDIADLDGRYSFATGPKLPAERQFDLVVDMRRLHEFYEDD